MGAYAVFGFYILSGYLMTLIMQQTYGYTLTGLRKYTVNRLLRIYPTYWFSVIFTIFLLAVFGQEALLMFKNALYWPDTITSWMRNIFIFFPDRQLPILTPPSWALTVELFFYCLIGLGLSKNSTVSVCWLCSGILYHMVAISLDFGWPNRYYTVWAASLPFSIGACIYHFRAEFQHRIELLTYVGIFRLLVIFCVVFSVNWLFGYVSGLSKGLFFYSNLVICAVAIGLFAGVEEKDQKVSRYDSVLGECSYPVYLIHYQVAALVYFFVNGMTAEFGLGRPSLLLLAGSLAPILIAAWLIARLIDRPINILRNQVRK